MPDWFISLATHPAMLVAAGGGAGANARYWFGRAVARWQRAWLPGVEFPWATFLINVSGSVALGAFAVAFVGHPDATRRNWYLLLGTGFCGGFTTFSTFSLETLDLLRADRPLAALAYALGSVAAGVCGAWLAVKATGK